jgi:plastocyanin
VIARVGARAVAALATVALLGLLASCATEASINRRAQGGTASAQPQDGVQVIRVTTGHDYRFHPSTIVVHPGRVKIILYNQPYNGGGSPHNLELTGLPGMQGTGDIQPGQTATASFIAPAPGRYRFECTIHAVQGQTGTLVVK